MSMFSDCRKDSDLAEHRASYRGRRRGRAYLMCLLALAAVGLIVAAVADSDSASPAAAGDASPLERVIDLLSGNADAPAAPASGHSKPKVEKAGKAEKPGSLVMEIENPEDYQKTAAASPYPPTDSPEKLVPEQIEAISKLAPKASAAGVQTHPAMVPLFRSMILHYTGGSYKNSPIRFRLHTPEPLTAGKKYPMVVWLHGAGECGSDNVDQLSHLHHIIPYLVGPKKRDFFLLVSQCPHAHVSWEAPEICLTRIRPNDSVECNVTDDPIALGNAPLSFTLAMVDAVLKSFPVDANRVTVAGLSTGGEGVWRILERRPDLFAAAAPIVSWKAMQPKSLREKPLLKKIPIWAIYSSDDRGIDFARKEFDRLRDCGCRVHKTEFGVCGHHAWTPAMLQGDVFGWLISRAKDGERFYAAEPSPTDPDKVGIFADVTEGHLKRQPTKAVKRPEPAQRSEEQPVLIVPRPVAPEVVEPQRTERGRTRRARAEPEAAAGPSARAIPHRPAGAVADQFDQMAIEQYRVQLMSRYLAMGEVKKAMAVAEKVKNRQMVVAVLLQASYRSEEQQQEVLDFIDRELDRMEHRGETPREGRSERAVPEVFVSPEKKQLSDAEEEPLRPIPAGSRKKTPMDECGKEWAMSPTTLYGLFPNGWDQEARHVPDYIVSETGKQLRARLDKAFSENDLPAMKELCESFIRLDDIPLSSPWFDTSGGRLHGRIKYALNEKSKPVVELLRDIARVKAESKRESVELAQKALKRIDAIIHPKIKE